MNRFARTSFRASIVGCITALLAVTLVACSGCNARDVGPTEGQVRFNDGSPVQSGRIEFRSQLSGDTFTSRIDSAGKVHPVDRHGHPGLPVGKYEVVVVQLVLTEDLAIEDHQHGRTVPRRYADYYTSPLKVEVSPDTNEIEISLSIE